MTEEKITFDDVKNIQTSEFMRFEDGKTYLIEIISTEIKQIETKFGIKYVVEIMVDSEKKEWATSLRTLKKLAEDIDKTRYFYIKLDKAGKTYNIIPEIHVNRKDIVKE